MIRFEQFKEVWTVDFEFVNRPGSGEKPVPVCCVAHELRSGRKVRLWQDQLNRPFADFRGSDALLVSYFAPAEIGCFLVLGWPVPRWVLDLYVEFRNLTNGLPTLAGNSLIGALAQFGLDSMDSSEKKEMRDLIQTGGPWSNEERRAILAYCEEDVNALDGLLPAILPSIDFPRAMYRGWYTIAVAAVESYGVPINTWWLKRLRKHWKELKLRAITEIDKDFGVYEKGSFRIDRFVEYLNRNRYSWPLLKSGKPELTDKVFKEMARIIPTIAPLRELRHMVSDMRLNELAVGKDGRNRYMVSPYGARTSRNTPSSKEYVFGPSVWIRNLIQPPPGCSLAYMDFEQQEFAIGAVLSGDKKMIAAYDSGDAYLAFGKQIGAIPPDGTKQTHRAIRDMYKVAILAVGYGMGVRALAFRIGKPEIVARQFLQDYREAYPVFWEWSENVQNHAVLNGWQKTVFGWTKSLPWEEDCNPRSLKNFPAQSNGAEILRLSVCLGIERKIRIVAQVHDAVMVEASNDRIKHDVEMMLSAMQEASRVVLSGFPLRVESKIIRYRNHYSDPRGDVMWAKVRKILRGLK